MSKRYKIVMVVIFVIVTAFLTLDVLDDRDGAQPQQHNGNPAHPMSNLEFTR